MASSAPSSDPSDAGDSKNKCTLKLSGDCLPCEELSSCEDVILLEDTTPTVCSSGDLICPVQGRRRPEGKKRRPSLQQLLRDNPQQIHKLGISVAWAKDNGVEESIARENQCRGKECPEDKTKLTKGKLDGVVKLQNTFQSFDLNDEIQTDEEIQNHKKLQRKKKGEDCDFLELNMEGDLRQSSCLPTQPTQEHEVLLESPMCKPSGNTDVGPFPELPATPKGQERAEKAGEASSLKSGTREPSTSSAHLEDDALRPPSTASRLMGRAFPWLHQRAVSMGRRRRGPEQETKSSPQRAPHGSRCLRGKTVHPDGPPEQLEPRIPTFSRYVLSHHEKYED